MPNIVVLVKQVPDTYSERKLSDGDHTLDRESADAVLDEINERAVEEALLIKESQGGEVTVVSVGPDRATDAIRKALSMGADKAVHVSDEALHGSDVAADRQGARRGHRHGRRCRPGHRRQRGDRRPRRCGARHHRRAARLPAAHPRPQGHRRRRAPSPSSGETEEGIAHLRRTCPPWSASARRSTSRATRPSRASWPRRRSRWRRSPWPTRVGVEVGLANAWSTVIEARPKPPRQAGQRVARRG